MWLRSTSTADTVTSAPSLDQTQFLTKLVYLDLLVTPRSCLTALHTGVGIFLSSLSYFVHVPTLPFGFSVAVSRHCLDGNPTGLHVWGVILNEPSIFYLVWLKNIFILLGFKLSFHHTNSSLYLCCLNQHSEIQLARSFGTVKFAVSTGNATSKNPLVLGCFVFLDCIILWCSRHYTISTD